MKLSSAEQDMALSSLARLAEFEAVEWELRRVGIDLIKPGRYQPRKDFSKETLLELGQSMLQTGGNTQAINLSQNEDGTYELVAGERRWRAAQLVGIGQLNALVAKLSDRQCMIIAMVENIQREDLNPMDEAEGFERMNKEAGLTHADIAAATGKSRAVISNAIRLTGLHTRVKDLLRQKKLSAAAGRTIAGLDDRNDQRAMADAALAGRWDIRRIEAEVAKKKTGIVKPVREKKSRDIERLEEAISERAGYPATVRVANTGRIELTFSFADNRGLQAFLEQQRFIEE